MSKIKRYAAVAALAAVGVGASATSASAYSFNPPGTSFTGTNTGAYVFATPGGASVRCTATSFAGSTPASGGAAARVRPSYSGCTATFAGVAFPATIVAASDWTLTITGGSSPNFTGSVQILAPSAGNAWTLSIPALGCSVFVNAQTFASGLTATNVTPPGVSAGTGLSSIGFTTNGACPFPGVGTATYSGVQDFPGITIS